VAKWCISGAPRVSRVVGAHPGCAAMRLGVCTFVPGLRSMVQNEVEQELWPPLSLMTWQIWRTRGVLLWAHGAQWGSVEQAGGDLEVWGAVAVIAGEGFVPVSTYTALSSPSPLECKETTISSLQQQIRC
jgi:hypothetical protein